MRVFILIAALLASTNAHAAPAGQEPKNDISSAGQDSGEAVRRLPPMQKFREHQRERLPSLREVVGENFNPAEAARQCATMAGESDYTLSAKNSSGGFSLTCKIERKRSE